MPRGRGSGSTPREAQDDYAENTTDSRYMNGATGEFGVNRAEDEGWYGEGIAAFLGVSEGDVAVSDAWDPQNSWADNYDDETDEETASRWFDGYRGWATGGGQ